MAMPILMNEISSVNFKILRVLFMVLGFSNGYNLIEVADYDCCRAARRLGISQCQSCGLAILRISIYEFLYPRLEKSKYGSHILKQLGGV